MKRNAFTLIELLLSLSLIVLATALIGSLMQIYSHNFATRGDDIRREQLARALLTKIADDIRSVVMPQEYDPSVLEQLSATLKPHGVLFSSNPRGNNEEGMQGERYGAYYDFATWRNYLTPAGFSEIEHYYRPAGLPVAQQHWLASVWRGNTG